MRRDLRTALIALAVAGWAFAAVGLGLILTSAHLDVGGVEVFFLVGNLLFMEVGLLTWWRRPDNRFGALMYATGFAGMLNTLQASNVSVVFTIGLFAGSLVAPLAAHMLLAFPSGRVVGWERWIVGLFWAGATIFFWPSILFMDPETYVHGTVGPLPANAALITVNDTIVNAFGVVRIVLAAIGVAGAIVCFTRRWREAGPLQRRAIGPVLAMGGATAVTWGAMVLAQGIAPYSTAVEVASWMMVVYAAIPVAFLVGMVRGRIFGAGAIGHLMADISDIPPGGLRDRLAGALGDQSLTLAYWLPDQGRYVDPDGRSVVLPEPGSGRTVTRVERDGYVVAALIHDDSLAAADAEMVRAAGAAVALALENERLDAELRANIAELEESRARIIEAGDAARRRIERDLHDGAQQRLVALALTLRMARARIARDPGEATDLLDRAGAELDQALAELRELARGIHPAILTDRGLTPALEALAGRAPIPVELTSDVGTRLPPPVEAAAYYVAAEALTNVARYAGATHAIVAVTRRNGTARIEVRDDGVGGADPGAGSGLRGLADRLAALDGRLQVTSPPGGGTVVAAEIPCGS